MIENFWNSEEVNLNNIELSEDDKNIIEKWMLIQSIMDGQFENRLKTHKYWNQLDNVLKNFGEEPDVKNK